MKKNALFLMLLVLAWCPATYLYGQVPDNSVYQIGGTGYDANCQIGDILVEKSHQMVLTGLVHGTIGVHSANSNFSSVYPKSTSSFLIKLNGAGKPLFQKVWGGDGSSSASELDEDATGNIYVNGLFIGGFSLDGFNAFSDNNKPDMGYLAKFNALGKTQWVKAPITNGDSYFTTMTTDSKGSLYTSIHTQNASSFTIDEKEYKASVNNFSVLFQFDKKGNHIWTKTLENAAVFAMEADGNGNLYISGQMKGSEATYDGKKLLIGNNPDNFIFFAKLDANSGSMQWIKKWETGEFSMLTKIRTGNKDGIYVGGYFYDSLTAGHESYHDQGSHAENFVLFKFDSAGNIGWCKLIPGKYGTDFTDFAIDKDDSLYLSGEIGDYFDYTAQFDTFKLISKAYDIFLLKLDPANGKIVAARNSVSVFPNLCTGGKIACDERNVYAVGSFTGSINLGGTILTESGYHDAYIWKVFSDTGNFQSDGLSSPQIGLFPNPAQDNSVQLTFSGAIPGNFIVECIDISGKSLFSFPYEFNPDQKIYSIPMQDVKPGIYCLKISSSSITISKKIVKE